MAKKIADMRAMSDADLESEYDSTAENTFVGLEWYRDEIHNRAMRKQAASLTRLTWLIAALTLGNVVIAAVLLAQT